MSSCFAATSSLSGTSVSLSSDGIMLAVGASALTTLSSSQIGHVLVYKYVNGSGWIQQGSKISGISWAGGYGKSVSLSSNGIVMAIGAPFNDITGFTLPDFPAVTDGGHVRVYQNNVSC